MIGHSRTVLKSLLCLLFFAVVAARANDAVRPFPRMRLPSEKVYAWTFDGSTQGWSAAHDCMVKAGDGRLVIQSTGNDPYLIGPAVPVTLEGPALVKLRIKCSTGSSGEIFWTTKQSPAWSEQQKATFRLQDTEDWQEVEASLNITGTLTRLRLDPGREPGKAQVDWIELYPLRLHPLEIEQAWTDASDAHLLLRNHADQAITASIGAASLEVPAGEARQVSTAVAGDAVLENVAVSVQSPGLPTQTLPLFLYRPQGQCDWIVQQKAGLTLQVARDGSVARLESSGQVLAVIGPIVHYDGIVPTLRQIGPADSLEWQGPGVTLKLRFSDGDLAMVIDSQKPCEGPVVRVPGDLEQGLFAGLEYLGKGESSSSTLDIETAEHLRYAPDPMKVTLPLMACRSAGGTVALTWSDMHLQPVFATPNFLDGPKGSRMALRGCRIEATVRASRGSLEDAIAWAVGNRGLPPLPKPPRTEAEQWQLCLAAINGPLSNGAGWGHCAEPKWGRQPYADIASTLYRLTGQVPVLERLVPGGAHVRNDTIFFLTGRAQEWLRLSKQHAANLIRQQQPDGSFRYRGKYQRGHFEDTSSGYCGLRTVMLLEHAARTGDDAARNAGLKALEYLRRFRTPRGAQTWELSLHTPDIMASAHLVRAYVLGHQLTGKREYLEQARKWALTGVPFVYLWGDKPVMAYATVPVYGATNWRAPNWIGLPVQWCGLVYAYALCQFAPYDQTLDWKQLAEGILIAGEQMQYPEGKLIGCLPDIFQLERQKRAGPSINPGALVSLRLALAGKLDSLSLASDGKHRVLAPFPVTLQDGNAHVHAKAGTSYQLLIDGARVVKIDSVGEDVVPLD